MLTRRVCLAAKKQAERAFSTSWAQTKPLRPLRPIDAGSTVNNFAALVGNTPLIRLNRVR